MLDNETLNAYADGELDEAARAAVEAALARDPAACARLARIRRTSLLARSAVDALSRKPVPAPLSDAVLPATPEPARALSGWPVAAWGGGLGLVLGLGLALLVDDPGGPVEPLVAARQVGWHQQAAWFHDLVGERHAAARPLLLDIPHQEPEVLEIGLLERLGNEIFVPDLGPYGLSLLGARLLVERAQPLAQIFYRDGQGDLVSLLIALDRAPDAAPDQVRVGDLLVLSWREGGRAYVLVGEPEQERLSVLATQVAEQSRR